MSDGWQRSHLLLYALLVAIPVLGVFLTWFRGDALSFFGLVTIPSPFSPDRAMAGFIKELHGLNANLIMIFAGVHAAAALWHHFIRKDDVIKRTLPRTKPMFSFGFSKPVQMNRTWNTPWSTPPSSRSIATARAQKEGSEPDHRLL